MNIVFLGPPGAGKGTQAQMLKECFGFTHISTGDLLREETSKGSELGQNIKKLIDAGSFVPDDLIIKLLIKSIEPIIKQNGSIVLDGFPRNIEQAEALEGIFQQKNITIDHVFAFEVDEQTLLRRITGRYMCKMCKTGYHDEYHPTRKEGVCDICGSTSFTRRADDKEEVVRSRLDIYKKETKPVVPYYAHKGILSSVDGMADIDKVSAQIKNIIRASS